jgi:general secretion pathway protein H
MPTLAVGSRAVARSAHRSVDPSGQEPASRERGFTLIELLVVMAIMALGIAGVVFAVRDTSAQHLDREAQRLAALLDAARAQSRAQGIGVRWRPVEGGFRFDGLADGALPRHWLSEAVQVRGTPVLVLGPEPLIPPQSIELTAPSAPGRVVTVSTDGVRPFRVGSPS